ncbi:MOSC domain-containing protein [Nostoc sp. KVJ3]|uniref:MOSC domain-containing protein n=1 Tax=Nostoc sp. KVJ3 TaxID=457945 RepID=UPI002237FBC1|nr:MOSC domain-containing protein [Nostoc sp. KVJ3]
MNEYASLNNASFHQGKSKFCDGRTENIKFKGRLWDRQVLIVMDEDILNLSIQPGDLRENIVVTGIGFDNFIPGSLLTFESGAAIRLTFHCEPCKRIAHLVESLKSIQGKRGILGVVDFSNILLDYKGYLINCVKQQQNKLETEGVKVLSEADLFKNLIKNFIDIKDYL